MPEDQAGSSLTCWIRVWISESDKPESNPGYEQDVLGQHDFTMPWLSHLKNGNNNSTWLLCGLNALVCFSYLTDLSPSATSLFFSCLSRLLLLGCLRAQTSLCFVLSFSFPFPPQPVLQF